MSPTAASNYKIAQAEGSRGGRNAKPKNRSQQETIGQALMRFENLVFDQYTHDRGNNQETSAPATAQYAPAWLQLRRRALSLQSKTISGQAPLYNIFENSIALNV
jgi:hypothetical protein